MPANIRFSICILLAFVFSFTACLKDQEYNDGSIQSTRATGAVIKPIEIKLTAASQTNVLSLAFDNSSQDTTIQLIPVNLATADAAPADIQVTLTQNDQIVTDYNTANGVSYVVPTLFTIVNAGGVVTIPKGSHTGYLQIKFKPSDFLGTTYALGFSITSVAGTGYTVSGNLQNGMVIINIKNQYDGNYHVSGTRIHPVLGPFPFSYDADMGTTSATSIDGNVLADLQSDLNITINPDNTVSLSSSAQTIFLSPGGVNKYDPVTKTFTLSYYYNAAAPRIITETLVKN